MVAERSQPIHFLGNSPSGWLDASLPKFNAQLQPLLTHEEFITHQEQRWEKLTGVSAENTRLTIIVPIRNEKELLETTLGTLALSDIPRSAHITFLFITNNCTDDGASINIITNFLNILGRVKEIETTKDLMIKNLDPRLDPKYQSVKVLNTEFIHLNTETAGKANAINLGNSVALNRNSLAMCIDADTTVETDAIVYLYRDAYNLFIRSPISDTAVVQGTYKSTRTKDNVIPKELQEIEVLQGLKPKDLLPIIKKPGVKVRGAFWAWKPETMIMLGGMPKVINEDMAFWFLARKKGFKIYQTDDAKIWGIIDESFESRRKMLVRLVRGWLQTIKAYPELEGDIKSHFFNLKDPDTGLNYDDLIEWQNQHPHVPEAALPIIFRLWIDVYQEGLEQFNKSGNDQSWDPSERRIVTVV